MLYTGSGNIPHHIYCWVDSSFIRKDVKPNTYEPCVWFALHAKAGHSWGCHVMLECGAVWRGVPPHALAFSANPEKTWHLEDTQIWDCYGDIRIYIANKQKFERPVCLVVTFLQSFL